MAGVLFPGAEGVFGIGDIVIQFEAVSEIRGKVRPDLVFRREWFETDRVFRCGMPLPGGFGQRVCAAQVTFEQQRLDLQVGGAHGQVGFRVMNQPLESLARFPGVLAFQCDTGLAKRCSVLIHEATEILA